MLQQSRLSPKEQKALDASLRRSKRRGPGGVGSIPPCVLLPLMIYLPRVFTIQEPYSEGGLAETLRSGFQLTVIETSYGEADMTVGALHTACAKDFEKLYETGKPFALLAPVDVMGDPDCQHLFQRFGVQIILLDRYILNGRSFAWYCWALPNLGFLTYGHVPQDEYLPSWMVNPVSRRAIQQGARSMH